MQKRMAFPTHMDTAVLYQWHGITNRQLCATVINTPKQEPSRTKKGDKDDSLLRDIVWHLQENNFIRTEIWASKKCGEN